MFLWVVTGSALLFCKDTCFSLWKFWVSEIWNCLILLSVFKWCLCTDHERLMDSPNQTHLHSVLFYARLKAVSRLNIWYIIQSFENNRKVASCFVVQVISVNGLFTNNKLINIDWVTCSEKTNDRHCREMWKYKLTVKGRR